MTTKKVKFVCDVSYNKDFHFFGSSVGRWYANNDLEEVLKQLRRDNLNFSIWYVPVPVQEPYDIRCFKPVVPGIVFLGHWSVE